MLDSRASSKTNWKQNGKRFLDVWPSPAVWLLPCCTLRENGLSLFQKLEIADNSLDRGGGTKVNTKLRRVGKWVVDLRGLRDGRVNMIKPCTKFSNIG